MRPVTTSSQLTKLELHGFKSIEQCELELGAINILIGSNGAGKSNFIDFFRMIQQILQGNLQLFVSKQGGPDAILHFGRKGTEALRIALYFGNNGYQATLEPTQDNRLVFADESFYWNVSGCKSIGRGHFETNAKRGTSTGIDQFVMNAMLSWKVYHFHDTSSSAQMKQVHPISDNLGLHGDARNLAAFLYRLQEYHPQEFRRVEQTVSLAAPFFKEFLLRPSIDNQETIEFRWFQRGMEQPFGAHQMSDGTLRFVCLAAVFLQPSELQPETILVDEPELGLHPYAITLLASMIRSASESKQVIVSTQSVELLNEFEPGDVIVVERAHEASQFKRLNNDALKVWLEDFALGELWKKNILGGRPN